MTHPFDFDKALSELQAGKDLTGKDGVLMPLIKQLTEAAIAAELEHHLAQEVEPNRKNGMGSKVIKTGSGSFELNAPRDRAGTFEPQLIKKHQTQLTPEIDRKIISLFSHGMSYRDIQYHIQDLYGIDVSTGALSAITDQLLPALKEWQQRPLDRIYPIMWMDAVHYKIKQDGRYAGKAIYTLLGLTVLTDIQNRGVEDILIACVDGLTGFPEAISSLYPQTEIQLCIIHQIRNSLKYVASKNQKAFMADLKLVYRASNKENAETALDQLEEKWGDTYPIVIKSWRKKWHHLSAYFKYPGPIRKIIYTTNSVEAVHRQFRKLTKTKGAFPNENSLLKLLYAGILNATEKWTMPIQNWSQALSQLDIYFEGRLDHVLDI